MLTEKHKALNYSDRIILIFQTEIGDLTSMCIAVHYHAYVEVHSQTHTRTDRTYWLQKYHTGPLLTFSYIVC